MGRDQYEIDNVKNVGRNPEHKRNVSHTTAMELDLVGKWNIGFSFLVTANLSTHQK